MKSENISFYFVLYLVAVVTVFAITVERDKSLEEQNRLIAEMIQLYVKPLRLYPTLDTTTVYMDISRQVTDDSVRVKFNSEGPLQRDDIEYTLVEADKVSGSTGHTPSLAGRSYNEKGDGVLVCPPLSEGTYKFVVAGHKPRIFVTGNTMAVMIGDSLRHIPYSPRFLAVDWDSTDLIVKVIKSGLEKQQITLNVAESNDHWVLGLPYTKKVYVGGIETMVSITATLNGDGHIEHPAGENYFLYTWDRPTTGKHSITVNVDANRGAGAKDKASTTFAVDVRPPSFTNAPGTKGFWGIPYIFDGQIGGINPLDLTVEYAHDGQPIGSGPAVPVTTITPTRGWKSLAFTVKYRGNIIKEHKAELSAPPPPQVRWTQQNLDKAQNLFMVQFTCTDAAGGPVSISIQSQPSGTATLDRIKGTNFTIKVNLSTNPSSVFIKLVATDQYGGQSTSSKQFVIPH